MDQTSARPARPLRFLLLLIALALVIFVGTSLTTLVLKARKDPAVAKRVRSLPVLGSLLPTGRPAAKSVIPHEQKDVPTFVRLRPFSAEQVNQLLALLEKQRRRNAARAEELEQSRARLELLRVQLADVKKEVEQMRRDVEKQWNALGDARVAFERGITDLDATRAKNLKRLALTYEGMRAERAGAILAGLDPDDATRILYLMETRKAGKLIEALAPELAAELMKKMTLLRPKAK